MNHNRIPALDGIRGLAILLVLLWHYIYCNVALVPGSIVSYALSPLRFAWSGVDLFFVLSGFLIGGILLDNRDARNYFKVFYARRAFRILPLYLILLSTLGALAIFRHPSPFFDYVFNIKAPWWSYATFTQNLAMARQSVLENNWIDVTWSLAVEEQFYLIVPLVIWLTPRRHLWKGLAGLCLAAIASRLLFLALRPDNINLLGHVLTPCRADALMIGVLTALAVRSPKVMGKIKRKHLIAVTSFLALVILTLFATKQQIGTVGMVTIGYTVLALFYATLILLAITSPESNIVTRFFNISALRRLGTFAYFVYLFHAQTNAALHRLLLSREPAFMTLNSVGVTLLAFIVTLILARLSWALIEKPLIRRGHRFAYNDKQAMAASAGGRIKGR